MKIRVSLSIGLIGKREEEVEYPDDHFDGMTEEEKQKELDAIWQEWAWNYIDGGASIVEE